MPCMRVRDVLSNFRLSGEERSEEIRRVKEERAPAPQANGLVFLITCLGGISPCNISPQQQISLPYITMMREHYKQLNTALAFQ